MFTEPPVIEDTPRTYRSDMSTARLQTQKTDPVEKAILTAQETLDSITKSFNFFRKAIVSILLLVIFLTYVGRFAKSPIFLTYIGIK